VILWQFKMTWQGRDIRLCG